MSRFSFLKPEPCVGACIGACGFSFARRKTYAFVLCRWVSVGTFIVTGQRSHLLRDESFSLTIFNQVLTHAYF